MRRLRIIRSLLNKGRSGSPRLSEHWMPAGACPERSRRAGMTSFPRKRESRKRRRRNYVHASTNAPSPPFALSSSKPVLSLSNWAIQALGEKDPTTGRRKSPQWTADDLLPFVHGTLLPHLRSLSGSPEREVIAGVFSDRNVVVCASPYNLKDVLEIVDNLDFKNPDDIHTVSHVYEGLLQKLGNENKLAGEFYTPRPVSRFVVQVV